jgi:hypothetical protein
VPSYQRLRGRSPSPKLRKQVARLARDDARLTRIHLDFCEFVDDWRSAGWPRGYFDPWEAQKLKQAGVDAVRVDRRAYVSSGWRAALCDSA